MPNRRDILKSIAAATSLAFDMPTRAASKTHLGLQFSTFNTLASSGWEGFARAMNLAHEVGYESLELAGLVGQPVESILAYAKQLNLAFHSLHMGNDQVRAARQSGESIQDVQDRVYTPAGVLDVARINLPIAKMLGCQWGVIAAAGRSNFESQSSLAMLCESFNACNTIAKSMQLGLSYYMHATDFKLVDGVTPFDLMLEHTDPSIRYQIDVCWAAAAGADPAELIERHHARIVSLHLKDLSPNRMQSATPGDGIVDFDSIRKASAKLHSPLLYVEIDGGPKVDAETESRKAFKYLSDSGW